jgi:hypothetical protein
MSFTAKRWHEFAGLVGEEKANRIRSNFDAVCSGLDGLIEDANATYSKQALTRINDAMEVIGNRIGLYKSGAKRPDKERPSEPEKQDG